MNKELNEVIVLLKEIKEILQDNFKEMQGWVGKTATFTYFERTKAGSYRHPLFKAIRDYE